MNKEHRVADLVAGATAGWRLASGQKTESLDYARQALAATAALNHPISETKIPLPHSAADESLSSELSNLIPGTEAAKLPLAYVRTTVPTDVYNPTGSPAWARGMEVANSYGPFVDSHEIPHWVDLIPHTISPQFAFASPANVFAVFPVRLALAPMNPIPLRSGSVWFLANLLAAAIPDGNFTGFAIEGGTLRASAPIQRVGNVSVLPAGATLTMTATLKPTPVPTPSTIGLDLASSILTLPKTVTIVFKQGNATVEALDASGIKLYGSQVDLTFAGDAPEALNNNTALLMPCRSSQANFAFASVQSTQFEPTGSAPIVKAGWLLPVATTSVSALGEAASGGAIFIELGKGAQLAWRLHNTIAQAAGWQLVLSGNLLFVVAGGTGDVNSATLTLWPERKPSTRHSSVEVRTQETFLVSLVTTPGSELVTALGDTSAHLDRPLAADGTRFRLQGGAVISILLNLSGETASVLGLGHEAQDKMVPVALENALIGVHYPNVFVISGILEDTKFLNATAVVFFNALWLLPTLPDPYAANFGLELITDRLNSAGTLSALLTWSGLDTVTVSFSVIPSAQQLPNSLLAANLPQSTDTTNAFSNLLAVRGTELGALATRRAAIALLDLSTRQDQFGVAFTTLGNRTHNTSASLLALNGMNLLGNGAAVFTFALPQVSWEPMEAVQNGIPLFPIAPSPASDGPPLTLQSPDEQKLIRLLPLPVLLNNIENVTAGKPLFAQFSLPFGLIANIQQNNEPIPKHGRNDARSRFFAEGGDFSLHRPDFSKVLRGAVQITLKPPFPENSAAQFGGSTTFYDPYVEAVLSNSPATIFSGEFGPSGFRPGVPLRRADLAGYGASIFSEWADTKTPGAHVSKVHFETVVGRTAFDVIQVATSLYHYRVRLVRTITMARQSSGWVQHTDSGWKAVSDGIFDFSDQPDFTNRIHRGAVGGVFNVRNIREQNTQFTTASGFLFRQVLFDADIGIDHRIKVTDQAPNPLFKDIEGQLVTLVPSRDLVGYILLAPGGVDPKPPILLELSKLAGPLTPTFACQAEVGTLAGKLGTTLRCSGAAVDIATDVSGSNPSIGAALLGAPALPREGAWSVGRRAKNEPAPSPLPKDSPVPLVNIPSDPAHWHFSDVADILRPAAPDHIYGFLQDTGTQKVLFDRPFVPVTPVGSPGVHLPAPPNFADVASLLNATGLFPDLSATTVLGSGADQLQNVDGGLKYHREFDFPADAKATLLDLKAIKVELAYADEAGKPTHLTFDIDPASSKRWSLTVERLCFQVIVPEIDAKPLIKVVGSFAGDDQTKPSLTKMRVVYGDSLQTLTNVLNRLQSLASFLPGGGGAGLSISLSGNKLTIRDVFAIPNLPLGLGQITDVSLDLGFTLQLSPMAADFVVGIGTQEKPFNWIVSPLSGNGLIDIGMKDSKPQLVVQAGIGLGLAINVAIAEGSASVVIALRLDVNGSKVTLMVVLTGQASVDVLGGLASVAVTLTAAVGLALKPFPVLPTFTPALPLATGVDFPSEEITFLASVSVGIHISVCWVVDVDWDGSWQFSQSVNTPALHMSL